MAPASLLPHAPVLDDILLVASDTDSDRNLAGKRLVGEAPAAVAALLAHAASDQWRFIQGQCTSWVAYRLNELNGIAFSNSFGGSGTWGNAKDWGTHAQSLRIAPDDTPAVGSVAW